jgi:hypothetical protein
LASFYEEFKRNKKRLENAVLEISTCAISGAVGTYANVDPKIEALTNKIGKKPFINGYTVQIEVSQQKSIIRDSRYLFIRNNPDISLDEEYDQPNTYLFAGRFYDKNSAYKFKHKIKAYFPDALVIKKKLSLPALKVIDKTEDNK